MKHFFISIALLLHCTIKLSAQTDTTIYRVELKIGTVLFGQAVAKEEGSFITLQKIDGSTQFLQWHEIKTYSATTLVPNGDAVKKIQQEEEVKRKYSNWYKGLVITGKDTFERWVYPKNDYNVIGPGLERVIHVANKQGQERDLQPENYQQLIIFGTDTVTYITYAVDNGKVGIFKVMDNGPCMLLQDRYENDETKDNMGPILIQAGPGMQGTMIMGGPTIRYVKTGDRFYLLYKGKWYKAKTKDGAIITDSFRGNCDDVFNECPEMVAQIKSKTFASDDIREIVQSFNACLKGKK